MTEPDALRAAPGEPMLLIAHRVRPEARDAFERFYAEVIVPAAQAVAPETARRMRLLRGVGPSPDGSYPYAFLADPMIEGATYGLDEILRQALGQEAMRERMAEWRTLLDSAATVYLQG